MSDIFGPIFDGSQLTRSVIETLKLWFPTYIREIELQRGYTPGEIQPPKTYAERWVFDSYPDDKIPAVVVVCPGMAEAPHSDGDGTVNGWWALGVGIIAAASTEDNSERLAKIYGAAARLILNQKGWLDEAAEYNGIEILDETFANIPDIEQARTMRSANVIARVQVLNMWNKYGGPAIPDPPDPINQPGSQWPEVEEVFTTIERIEEE
jgi:hypothetical protein